jgi:hypothetical protein
MYYTFDRKNCVIRTRPGQPLTQPELCYILLTAFHGRRHSAILKLTLIMVGADSIKKLLLVKQVLCTHLRISISATLTTFVKYCLHRLLQQS